MNRLSPALLLAAMLAVPSASLAADAKTPAPKAEAAKDAPKKDPAKAEGALSEKEIQAAIDQKMGAVGGATSALGAAMMAAKNAPAGKTPCESAYNGMSAMVAALKDKMPADQQRPMPPKDKFLVKCAELPADVQKCLSIAYAMDHVAECQAVNAKLDPATMEKMKALGQ